MNQEGLTQFITRLNKFDSTNQIHLKCALLLFYFYKIKTKTASFCFIFISKQDLAQVTANYNNCEHSNNIQLKT